VTPTKPIKVTDEVRWGLLQRKAREVRAVRAFSLFREQGIEPILIKGLAAAYYYPESHHRNSVDMDLAVAADDFAKAEVIATSAGTAGLAIDIHRELRHLDTVPWDDLFANSQLIEFDGGTLRVLRPEDHLRVLCVHWLNDGGINKERLWDIYYAVKNRGTRFDWDRFLKLVSQRRQRWLICTIGLAHRYLGLELDDTPLKENALDLPEWLIKTLEREWANAVELIPLWTVLNDRKTLIQQMKKRLRPNPIQATIEMEGRFDAKTRVFYQFGNFFQRILPSYRRIWNTLKPQSK
jgi:hypothetical protein